MKFTRETWHQLASICGVWQRFFKPHLTTYTPAKKNFNSPKKHQQFHIHLKSYQHLHTTVYIYTIYTIEIYITQIPKNDGLEDVSPFKHGVILGIYVKFQVRVYTFKKISKNTHSFLDAHRQGTRVTTLHMGNGWVTLQPCLCAADASFDLNFSSPIAWICLFDAWEKKVKTYYLKWLVIYIYIYVYIFSGDLPWHTSKKST